MSPAGLLEMTPSKSQAASNGMIGYQGSPARSGGTSTTAQRSPWGQVQAPRAPSLGSGSFRVNRDGTQSPPSPEPSVSSTDTLTGHVYPSSARQIGSGAANLSHQQWVGGLNPDASPGRGHGQKSKQAIPNKFSYGSPEAVRSISRHARAFSMALDSPGTHHGTQKGEDSSFGSPDISRNVARGTQELGVMYGSPVRIGQQLERRDSITGQDPRMSYGNPVPAQRRESTVSQGMSSFQPSRSSSSSTAASNGAAVRASGLFHPTLNTNGQAMYAIPEEAAVQEFAFRRGQQDRGNTRDRLPPNPYHPSFDVMWETYYKKGKISGGDPIALPADPPSPSRANYDWPPLVNAFTQTPEHPHGIYDERFARSVCESALDAMESLVKTVCKRGKTWQSTVCDVPHPITTALLNYPDLLDRYEDLKSAAREAVGGGLPYNRR